MEYGPNTLAAKDFIHSLRNLTESELEDSLDALYSSYPDITTATDTATKTVWAVASNCGREDQLDAARIAMRAVVDSLGWKSPDQLKAAAEKALGAIVVFDQVPLRELNPAFLPFRYTSAELPVEWGKN